MTQDWTDSALRDYELRQRAARALRPSTCPRRPVQAPSSHVPALSVGLVLALGLYLWSVLQ